MYLSFVIFLLIFFNNHSLSSSSSLSICSEYYSSVTCECEDISSNDQSYISLKCSNIPKLYTKLNYRTIEFEYCSDDLNFEENFFNNLTINIIRIRHCNLLHLNDESFSNIKDLEKFSLENSTIKSLSTSTKNFQDVFASNSFQILKSLTLKNIHYHQIHSHDKKLNFEYLLQQLPNLSRLELINIYLDNYRYYNIKSIGQYLTYLSLTNTHQTSLIPIEYLNSLENLLIRHLPDIFQSQPLISSLKKLKSLKYILFEHNQLKSIENLQSNTIDDIDLSSNLIENIDEYTFEYVPKLRQLTLSNNPLNSIDQNAFCGIENLQRLSINIKHRLISPLNNCLLFHYPYLKISQDSQTKFQCNCQLLEIFHLQEQPINRLFKSNQYCLLLNQTNSQPIYLHKLNNYLNCSTINQCQQRTCQDRKKKISSTINLQKINPKFISSNMNTLYSSSFFVIMLFVFVNIYYLSVF